MFGQNANGCGRWSCCKTCVEYIKRAGNRPCGSFADLFPMKTLWPGATPLPLCNNYGYTCEEGRSRRHLQSARAVMRGCSQCGRPAMYFIQAPDRTPIACCLRLTPGMGTPLQSTKMHVTGIDGLACKRLGWPRASYVHRLNRSANRDKVLHLRVLSLSFERGAGIRLNRHKQSRGPTSIWAAMAAEPRNQCAKWPASSFVSQRARPSHSEMVRLGYRTARHSRCSQRLSYSAPSTCNCECKPALLPQTGSHLSLIQCWRWLWLFAQC